MTVQPFAHRKLFLTDRGPRDLVAVLKNEDNVHQKGLYDLDGTLHRGVYPSLLHGISNADLAIYLALRIPFLQLPRFVSEGIDIFCYERRHIQEGKDEDRPRHISFLVNSFQRSLERFPERLIMNAVQFIPRMRYPHAREVLREIRADGVIISCGFHPVVEAYGNVFGIENIYANPLFEFDPKQHRGIYGAGDKERIARSIDADRFVVIGDTADDIGMADAAKSRNPESVVIAMHGRCSHLASRADIIASSWKDIAALLETD
ncbi:haloacid dehalogenase-like hydrolase [Candidatus Woesearchaeota archaeon]|nr:haloacid dehalogenase-like hydrolase [Candidatus Woesearchaeota archaeon]